MIRAIRADNPGPFTLDGTQSWIIEGRAIIDPGPDDPRHLARLADAAPDLELIFVTHRHADHAPGALRMKQQYGTKIAAPAGALNPEAIDILLQDEASFEIGTRTVRAIATPGHTSEHFCFFTDTRELFTGDAILGTGTTTIFPPDGDMASYMRSLERMRALDPVILYPGHGPERADAIEWIDYYIQHRIERSQQIVTALSGSRRTISELRRLIYSDLDSRLHDAAETQLLAHLIHLQQQQRVSSDGDRYSSAD